ncbi:hypothetical protein Poli38472_004326 [Pythium oligandrum]|uniref:Protein kinase domain-containing protein n=1 Tax=Pythium oligandrum TaxID=41045 RepID=A0A8K1C9W3_PYTOL|nr:hypothetical protein Poli38472_004326 [Pythium oligandrum]|eukprot:TMW59257.1 hypothetical protein Poli38472_004326 [Pythium oligandrum]
MHVSRALKADEDRKTGDSIANPVVERCLSILESGGNAAATAKPQVVTVDMPVDDKELNTTLFNNTVEWSELSDTARVAVLYAHGYVMYGGVDSSTPATKLIKVYTDCSHDPTARLSAPQIRQGSKMSVIDRTKAEFEATGCKQDVCGPMDRAMNSECPAVEPLPFKCAINYTKDIPPSDASIWVQPKSMGSSIPYPQAFAHTIMANDSKTSINLISIHMRSSDSSTDCSGIGDMVIPCIRFENVTGNNKMCRPSVNQEEMKAFFSKLKLITASSSATQLNGDSGSGNGVSVGVIAGISVGVLLVLAVGAYLFFRKRKSSRAETTEPALYTGYNSTSQKSAQRLGPNRDHSMPPVIDTQRDNDTVQSTDLYHNTNSTMNSTTNSRAYSDMSSTSTRGGNATLLGKSLEEYCEESDILRNFVSDSRIQMKRIAHDEITVLRPLSKGSYGEVYLGQLETRHVAIKRLLPEKKHFTRSIEQFSSEIRLMSALEHRNIVQFVGVSWDHLQNMSAIVEYMDSGDLSEVLTKNKTTLAWPKEKISIAMDVAEGLVYLHSMRPVVVHRDLKSKNVLINKRGLAKLSDFGVSRKTTVNETMTSGVGTLLWTAPEIIEGRKYSEKADIFSLGVVLSEIDTCEEPYLSKRGDTGERIPGMQIVQMVRLGHLKVDFRPDCPSKVRELAMQCTALDPDLRPTSMEVAYTLKSIIAPLLRDDHGSSSGYNRP